MEKYLQEGQQSEPASQFHELTFSIKKLDASEKVTEVSVNFPVVSRSPVEGEEVGEGGEMVNAKSIPVFNHDKTHFTPCFVLDSDKFKVKKNLNHYESYHVSRIEEMEEEKEELLVAKPSKNHCFCGLCRVHFEDYLTHIMLEIHKENVKKAKFDKKITSLTSILKKKDQRLEKQLKKLAKEASKQRGIKKQRKPRAVKIAKHILAEELNSLSTVLVA